MFLLKTEKLFAEKINDSQREPDFEPVLFFTIMSSEYMYKKTISSKCKLSLLFDMINLTQIICLV